MQPTAKHRCSLLILGLLVVPLLLPSEGHASNYAGVTISENADMKDSAGDDTWPVASATCSYGVGSGSAECGVTADGTIRGTAGSFLVPGPYYTQASTLIRTSQTIEIEVTQAGRIVFPVQLTVSASVPATLPSQQGHALSDCYFGVGVDRVTEITHWGRYLCASAGFPTDEASLDMSKANISASDYSFSDGVLSLSTTIWVNEDLPYHEFVSNTHTVDLAIYGRTDVGFLYPDGLVDASMSVEMSYGSGGFWENLDGTTAHFYDLNNPVNSIPEPTTLGLLALSGLAVLRRRHTKVRILELSGPGIGCHLE